MDMNGSSASVENNEAISCVAQFVNILLVDHDTTSLMSVASQLEHQLYKVTSTESAAVALSLFQEQIYYYDIVIADIGMPEMEISEFLEKLHAHRMTIPVILIVEESTMHSVMENLSERVCYCFPKPPTHCDISNVWTHVCRVTGNMPSSSEKTKNIDIDRDYNPSSALVNQNQKNLKMNNDKNTLKRKKNQIEETSNASSDNSKNPRLSWNHNLHQKFMQALRVLGEHGAKPKAILNLMNEPNLTTRHVKSHLQNYKNNKDQFLNLEKGKPLNVENLAEGTNGSHQQFVEMPSEDEVNKLIEELKASGFNINEDVIN
ncbi:two-component response regulator ARR12-like [Apium graveolens]|uniref:two-component response regulator ARR12-like n=1 Tax=Apium graveolens TaxID=4045 RepID=UPI003D7B6E23